MTRFLSQAFGLSLALSFSIACVPTTVTSAPVVSQSGKATTAVKTSGGSLLQQDFNQGTAWTNLSALPTAGITATATYKPVGTIDTVESTTTSGAVLLSVRNNASAKDTIWNAGVTSGLLPVRNAETNLGKLTLSFDHSISSVRPVVVQIESFNAKKKRTGGRQGVVYPAAPDFFLRSALELSSMEAFGDGTFQPTNPFVKITFRIQNQPEGGNVKDAETTELRIDNVNYARPAYYVSPKGSDTNDGRTEKNAFATPQKAIDVAQPGDIVLVMNGTYAAQSDQGGVVSFRRPGTPAAWISLKNYPGQHPVFSSIGTWNAIKIGQRGSSKEAPSTEPALAYLEVRGLRIRGDSDVAKEKYADRIGKPDPFTNGNAISVLGRFETYVPHHIRIADNRIEYCAGGGISGIQGDWLAIENNSVRNNCWWMIYAGSGISFLDSANFDRADNIYKSLIRNNTVSGNRCFVKWAAVNKISDGNGIIVDTNYVPDKKQIYRGRTLVQNNLSFNNGGSGIHSFHSHRVDIVNNTAYYNGASPELNWGQIFVQLADDVKIVNNILVSRPGQPINSVGKDGGDQRSTNIMRANNLYFGGLSPQLTGEGDVFADPIFVNPSTDPDVADFHVRPGSPALQSGWRGAILPLLDLDGNPRPTTTASDRGAYQHGATPPTHATNTKKR